MYREHILDLYRNPANFGTLENAEISFKDANPICGDEIAIQIKLDQNKGIKDIRFNGHGCAISQAAASLLTEEVKGKDVSFALSFQRSQMLELLGIELSPVRVKCGLLALKVLKMGICLHHGKQFDVKEGDYG